MPTETDNEEKTLVNFRLGVEQKQDWEEYIEESGEYTTLTQLIRSSVEAKISGGYDNDSPESPAISSDVQQVRDDIDRIKKDVRWLKNQSQDSADISDVAQDVFDELVILPERQGRRPEDVDADPKQLAAMAVVTPEEREDWHPQTISDIAERVGISEGECADAIQHLQDQFLPVVEVELYADTHYFKEN